MHTWLNDIHIYTFFWPINVFLLNIVKAFVPFMTKTTSFPPFYDGYEENIFCFETFTRACTENFVVGGGGLHFFLNKTTY